jgi:Protein of unknown function (DUF2917)
MIALEREASLRVEPGTRVEIACLSGVVWITHAGDARDLFLAPGESLVLPLRGVTLITALEPATVRVLDCAAQRHSALGWWPRVTRAIRGLLRWPGLAAGTTAVIKPPTVVAG